MNNIDITYRAGILLAAARQQAAEARTNEQRREAACRLRAMRSIVKAN